MVMQLLFLGKLELCKDLEVIHRKQFLLTLRANPPSAYTVLYLSHSYRHTKLSSDLESLKNMLQASILCAVPRGPVPERLRREPYLCSSCNGIALLLLDSAGHYTCMYAQHLLRRFVLLNLHRKVNMSGQKLETGPNPNVQPHPTSNATSNKAASYTM